jgi:hypothetical protein
MTDEPKKFDPSRDLMSEENRTPQPLEDGVIRMKLQPWTIMVPLEMITAVDFIITNAKGLGYSTPDEFVREAIRDKIAQINRQFGPAPPGKV